MAKRHATLNNPFNGNDQDEFIRGSSRGETINGGGGNDSILARGGHDVVVAGKGSDTVKGGSGQDRLIWNNGDGSDTLDGNSGIDTAVVNDSLTQSDQFKLYQQGDTAVFKRLNLVPFSLRTNNIEQFEINATGGDDSLKVQNLANTDIRQVTFSGGVGKDTLDASTTNVKIIAFGGDDVDVLSGGFADDIIDGQKGDDVMNGGDGNDRLIWNNGDGSDLLNGGNGYDTSVVNGAPVDGDQFVISQNGTNAIFDRVNLGTFKLTTQNVEEFEVNAAGGNDSLVVGDLFNTLIDQVKFFGAEGNDIANASQTTVDLIADGGVGNDTLVGGNGDDTITGGDGVDSLTGGQGSDQFVYAGNPFANGTPTATPNGIVALNQPDELTDYQIGVDQFAIKGQDFGISNLAFQEGLASQLTGNNNLLVLLDTNLPNAAAAAKAIADNTNVTAKEGLFVYFNTTLGINRVVYSRDLANGGEISVLTNLRGDAGKGANIQNFSSVDFQLV